MNKLLPLFILLSFLAACNSPTATTHPVVEEKKPEYPEELQKVFTKHGTLGKWQTMQALSYEIADPEGNEKQSIDLNDRRERIEGSNFLTGHDGKNIWLKADSSYKGKPKFYHNLMFYFYAMPFVLADPGIIYTPADPLEFEGISHPGYRISYGKNVGDSPEDEYFIHYDPTTYQMAWLGYTVTFFSKEQSKKISWIRYNDWKDYKGLLLPKSITWYKEEEGKLTSPRKTVEFDKVVISKTGFDDELFAMPDGAAVVE